MTFPTLIRSILPSRRHSVWRTGHRSGAVHSMAGDSCLPPEYHLPHAALGLWGGAGKDSHKPNNLFRTNQTFK